jgi:hypothetical protein
MTTRILLAGVAAVLLVAAFVRAQSAVSLSKPGHEDLTFWTNHNGLSEIDVEGEVGFGDLARIVMRRRSNAAAMRALRDRFTFKVRDPAAVETPDVFRAALTAQGLEWRRKPETMIVAEGRIVNVPVVIERTGAEAVPYMARLRDGRVTVRYGGHELSAEVKADVRPLARLRVRLREQGKPVSARVYLTAADGLAYAPKGAISRVAALPAEYYFHAEDTFELDLPAGETTIEATRGQEYELSSRKIVLDRGKPAEVTLELKRWEHLARKGWYSGDVHIHANYTAEHHQTITPADVRLQTLGEDLNYANMMVANSSRGFLHDKQHFTGAPHSLSRPDYLIYWNEEMRNSGLYGHMCFLNLKSLVEPLYTGFRDTPQWEDYPPNYTQAAAAKKQGGAVSYAHPGYGATFEGASMREAPVDLALGALDAIDVLSNNPEEVGSELWRRLLNCGFRVGISAGTDAFTNVADHYIPGGGRVYVQGGGQLDNAAWIRSYREGRTFASNGPGLIMTVDGRGPGEELKYSGPSRTVRVQASIKTYVPVTAVEILVNGVVAAKGASLTLDEKVTLDRSAWIAVRATGPWHRMVLNDTSVFAHTSPVYVTLDAKPIAVAEDLRFYVDWIDRLIARTLKQGRFATPEKRQEVVDLFRRAQEIYSRRLAAAR